MPHTDSVGALLDLWLFLGVLEESLDVPPPRKHLRVRYLYTFPLEVDMTRAGRRPGPRPHLLPAFARLNCAPLPRTPFRNRWRTSAWASVGRPLKSGRTHWSGPEGPPPALLGQGRSSPACPPPALAPRQPLPSPPPVTPSRRCRPPLCSTNGIRFWWRRRGRRCRRHRPAGGV